MHVVAVVLSSYVAVVPPRAPDIVAICVLQILLHNNKMGDGNLVDSHQMLPASKSRVMTTAETSQVGAFCL